MKKIRIAIDTSVISGIKDNIFRNEVLLLFGEIYKNKRKIEVMIPPQVLLELTFAPEEVKEFFNMLVEINCISFEKSLSLSKKHKSLKRKLYEEILLKVTKKGKKIKKSDLKIYAESVVLKCDYLLTYNNDDLIENKRLLQSTVKSYKNFKITKIVHPKWFISRITGRL